MKYRLALAGVSLLALAATVAVPTGASAKSGYDIIISYGGTNAAGHGTGASEYSAPDKASIMQIGRYGDHQIQLTRAASEPLETLSYFTNIGRVGHALNFARVYAKKKLKKDRKVVIAAEGINDADMALLRVGSTAYDNMVLRISHIMEANGKHRVIGIIFQDMESVAGNPPSSYVSDAKKIFKSLRSEWGKRSAGMAILINQAPRAYGNTTDVTRSLKRMVKKLGRSGIVSSKRLKSNPNNAAHFDAAAQMKMGKRGFKALTKISN